MSGRKGNEPSATPSEKKPERRIIYIIYEGAKTEPNYFDHYSRSLGRSCEFEKIPRADVDKNQTDRNYLIDIASGYMRHITKGECSPYYFITLVLDDCYKYLNSENKNKLKKLSLVIRRNAIREFNNIKGLIIGDVVTDYKVGSEEVIKAIRAKGVSINGYSFNNFYLFSKPDETYAPYDRVFIVFDRDYSRNDPTSRTKEDYDNYIGKCKEYGYDALVSTPMFEFWQLLHHKNVDYSDYHYDLSLSEGKI